MAISRHHLTRLSVLVGPLYELFGDN
ncbi:MAG: hypothetical protein JWN96_2364, partial [Mycobacterium sp.]|nr:hypothetical protein [Mycobacterium sp.]